MVIQEVFLLCIEMEVHNENFKNNNSYCLAYFVCGRLGRL